MSQVIGRQHGGVALYRQIARILEEEVRARYQQGQWLPSEQELATRFGVNRHTLRRAVDELVAAGMVERRHGRGIRVLDPAINYPLHAGTRFTDTLAEQNLDGDSRLIEKKVVPASAGVARHLRLGHHAEVAWIELLRLGNGRPLCVASAFFPCPRFQDLPRLYDGGSLHAFLADQYGLRPRRTLSLITAVTPTGDDASLLHLPRTRPLLRVKSVNVDPETEQPVEYVVTRFRGDAIQLEVEP